MYQHSTTLDDDFIYLVILSSFGETQKEHFQCSQMWTKKKSQKMTETLEFSSSFSLFCSVNEIRGNKISSSGRSCATLENALNFQLRLPHSPLCCRCRFGPRWKKRVIFNLWHRISRENSEAFLIFQEFLISEQFFFFCYGWKIFFISRKRWKFSLIDFSFYLHCAGLCVLRKDFNFLLSRLPFECRTTSGGFN